jgi:hypothetical protein
MNPCRSQTSYISVAAHAQGNVIGGEPEIREDDVFVVLILRREASTKAVMSVVGREVQASVAHAPAQGFRIYRKAQASTYPWASSGWSA